MIEFNASRLSGDDFQIEYIGQGLYEVTLTTTIKGVPCGITMLERNGELFNEIHNSSEARMKLVNLLRRKGKIKWIRKQE